MNSRWQYRILSILGTIFLTAAAVFVTNFSSIHTAFSNVPYFGRPAPEVLATADLRFAMMTTAVVFLASMWPLFKPRPRRILDTILLTQKRVLLAMTFLAALGYFNYSYRLPRTSLMLITLALLAALPLFMVVIRRRPRSTSRAVIVGDDPEAMESLLGATDIEVLGYVSPPSAYAPDGLESREVELADGGTVESELDSLPCLGGLARLEDVFVKHDVDTALLAFAETDREEFFGTLEHCHDHGVNALVHQDHADHVLTSDFTGDALLEVDLEPLDWQDYLVKRVFDIVFSGVALVVMLPMIVAISVAIKLDDGGPLLYRQERTAEFGQTFTVHKFRSMTPAKEDCTPDSEEKDRVTRVGRVIRTTHLDEIPQLWAILTGKMSVVGPRAVWTNEETLLEEKATAWRKRWFIKPGLTGLAQIRNATSADADAKLRYDLEYTRRQSFWFDLKIVVRQLWMVANDFVGFLRSDGSDEEKMTSTEIPSDGNSEKGQRKGESQTDTDRNTDDAVADQPHT